MGGVLPEQQDPTRFRRVLNIGCGPGGWIDAKLTQNWRNHLPSDILFLERVNDVEGQAKDDPSWEVR